MNEGLVEREVGIGQKMNAYPVMEIDKEPLNRWERKCVQAVTRSVNLLRRPEFDLSTGSREFTQFVYELVDNKLAEALKKRYMIVVTKDLLKELGINNDDMRTVSESFKHLKAAYKSYLNPQSQARY